MSFQRLRADLAGAIETIVNGLSWEVTTLTFPTLHHKTIVVGHASSIDADTFRSFTAVVPVTLWVSEADDTEGVDQLYDLLSPGPVSLLVNLPTTPPMQGRITTVRAHDVGPRDEGPSGFLAADIDVALFLDAGLNGDVVW